MPTVSSDVGGFPDIVIPGETGCLVRAKDPQDLAQKLLWALDHPAEMKEMAVKGQALVRQLLDLSNTASAIKNIYGKILEK